MIFVDLASGLSLFIKTVPATKSQHKSHQLVFYVNKGFDTPAIYPFTSRNYKFERCSYGNILEVILNGLTNKPQAFTKFDIVQVDN